MTNPNKASTGSTSTAPSAPAPTSSPAPVSTPTPSAAPTRSQPSSPFGPGSKGPAGKAVPLVKGPQADLGIPNERVGKPDAPVDKPRTGEFEDLIFDDGDEKPVDRQIKSKTKVEDENEETSEVEQKPDPIELDVPEVESEDVEGETSRENATNNDAKTDTQSGRRDYSQYDPDVAKILKKLPNETYRTAAAQIQKWKSAHDNAAKLEEKMAQLAKEKPRFLAEHPQAYRLTPEFNQANEAYQEASAHRSFWIDQLKNIKRANAWIEFTGYDQQGKPTYIEHPASETGQPDSEAEIAVQMKISELAAMAAQHRTAANNIAQNYGQFQKAGLEELKTTADKLFKGWNETKLTPQEKGIYNRVISMLPQQFTDNPLAPYIALTFVRHLSMVKGYQKTLNELAAYKKGKQPATAGPRKAISGGNGAANNGEEVDLQGWFKSL